MAAPLETRSALAVERTPRVADRVVHAIGRRLHAALDPEQVRLELHDGAAFGPARAAALATVRLTDARAPFELAFDPQLAFGDLYATGRMQVEGSLVDLVCATNDAPPRVMMNPSRAQTNAPPPSSAKLMRTPGLLRMSWSISKYQFISGSRKRSAARPAQRLPGICRRDETFMGSK